MRSCIDCVHCYLKQAANCMKIAGINDEKIQYEVILKLMDYVKTYKPEDSPAVNSTKTLLKIYEWIGIKDPYEKIKKESNDLALKLYPSLKNIVQSSKDRLHTALKISVAGNIIDLGIYKNFDIEGELERCLESGFSLDHTGRFLEKLAETDEILFLGDNAGEIVFDRILTEELNSMGKKVTYVVKAGPCLNDSTMEDAVYTGMIKVARVIDNGTNHLGTCLDTVSAEFLQEFDNAKLMIAKGQANFENLEQELRARDRIFFMLKIKCEEVGRVAGAQHGDVVFFTR